MPLGSSARPQRAVREAIAQSQLMLGWVEDFPQTCMVAGQKLLAIRWCDLEHECPRHATAPAK